MSYDISFWDYAPGSVAGDFDRALAVFETLQDKPRSLTSRLPEFARAAEALLTAPDQDEALRRHFQGFARQADGKEAVLTVELPATDRLPVFRQLVELATAKGLAVLDGQMGILFLPDGRVLPEEAGYAWQDIKTELDAGDVDGELPRKLTDFKKMVDKDVGKILTAIGFRKGKTPQHEEPAFVRDVNDAIRQFVVVTCKNAYPYYEIGVRLSIDCNVINEVVDMFDFPVKTLTVRNSLYLYSGYRGEIGGMEDYREFFPVFNKYVISLMEKAKDVQGLNFVVNGDYDGRFAQSIRHTSCLPYCLVAAWLAGNPKINTLISDLDDAVEKNWSTDSGVVQNVRERNEVFRQKWEALKAYVQSTPAPTS